VRRPSVMRAGTLPLFFQRVCELALASSLTGPWSVKDSAMLPNPSRQIDVVCRAAARVQGTDTFEQGYGLVPNDL